MMNPGFPARKTRFPRLERRHGRLVPAPESPAQARPRRYPRSWSEMVGQAPRTHPRWRTSERKLSEVGSGATGRRSSSTYRQPISSGGSPVTSVRARSSAPSQRPLQATEIERLPERQPVQVVLRVGDVARRVFQEELRREAGVLAARRPGQGAEREMGLVEMEHVDEVADLAPPRQGQDLVDCGIGVVQAIPEAVVFLHRVEAECAVLSPLDSQRPRFPRAPQRGGRWGCAAARRARSRRYPSVAASVSALWATLSSRSWNRSRSAEYRGVFVRPMQHRRPRDVAVGAAVGGWRR